MERFEMLLLDVWREACRHIEIAEFAETAARLLERHMPLEQLLLRRLEGTPPNLATVALAPSAPSAMMGDARCEWTAAERKKVVSWCRGQALLRGGKRYPNPLPLLLPRPFAGEGDVLAVPLANQQEPLGVLLLLAGPRTTFSSAHVALAEALREPFSVALENDRRLHEIATLREAAEADRGALLRRLGRTDVADVVVGEQSGLQLVMQRVDLVSNSDVPVLILGETGTGKELIGRAIHTRSGRHGGPFIRVNCGAIPAELIDAQLFGHEKGSFTGADQSRAGWFERADGGTLFLDEIGELPLPAQVRFLRVLQDGFVERVGGNQPLHVDVRVVAATHRDLASMVREGKFREDLWYRLAVFPILLPPLRERLSDIPALAAHFAERAAVRFGLPVVMPSDEDLRLLQAYQWPGNIRELGAVIDRAAILGEGIQLQVAKALGFSQIPDRMPAVQSPIPQSTVAASPNGLASAPPIASLDEAMRQHIEHALTLTGGRIEGPRGTAALLKINPHTLRARMRKLGIDWSSFRDG